MLLRCESLEPPMSQMGQSHQSNVANASPDVRFSSSSVRISAAQGIDAVCQEETFRRSSFDHVIGAQDDRRRDSEGERLRSP
jgi:hypothetical protein